MNPRMFDAVIIGAGQAGPALAVRLAKAGRKVAIVERKWFGGTCVNTGCTPTKTLVASAYAAHLARRAADFGVTLKGAVGVDMKRVKARQDGVVGAARAGLETLVRGTEGCTVFQGHARFTAPNQVQVGDETLTAGQVFINVGGRARVPDLPGVDKVSTLSTTPRSLNWTPCRGAWSSSAAATSGWSSRRSIADLGPRSAWLKWARASSGARTPMCRTRSRTSSPARGSACA